MSEDPTPLGVPTHHHQTPTSRNDRINISEIYDHILPYLDVPTQAKLMRVSRLWYERTGRILYRDLSYDVDCHADPPIGNAFGFYHRDFQNTSDDVQMAQSIRVKKGEDYQIGRTSKKDMLKNCRVLRVYPHLSFYFIDSTNDLCDAAQLDRNWKLNPEVLVLTMLAPKDAYSFMRGDHHLTFNHRGSTTTTGICPMVEALTPKKLVVREWFMPASEQIHNLPKFNSVTKIVFVISSKVLISHITLPRFFSFGQWKEAPKPGRGFSTGASNADAVFIFQGISQAYAEPCVALTWMRPFAQELVSHLGTGGIITTIVNAANLPIQTSNPPSFGGLLKELFFEVPWVDFSELEDRWNRVKFVTKEEYMAQGARELEGELDDIVW